MAYVHCVFFQFKSSASEADKDAQIGDAADLLAKVPTVRRIESGRRDGTISREVSMTDFDLGLLVLFDNRAGYDVYADHPLHLDYIARHKAGWQKVQVADYETA